MSQSAKCVSSPMAQSIHMWPVKTESKREVTSEQSYASKDKHT